MKLAKTLSIIIFLLFCLCSCNKRYPYSMQIADSLVNTRPDSAFALLKQLKDSISQEPKSTQMYYWLLTIKAQDKAYITHTSDSIILKVLHYYEDKQDKKHLPEAYYYAGSVYRDLEDAPQALDYFIEATKVLNEHTDYKLASLIYTQIGTLYLYQNVYDKALNVFDKAYHYSTLAKDSASMVYDLRDFGRTFSTLKQQDSALYYYKEADKLAEKISNEDLRSMVNGELSAYYTELGMYQEAYKSLQIALKTIDSVDLASHYCSVARYYFHTNQLDSATHYYSRLFNTNKYPYKAEYYQGLGDIARLKGQYKEALLFFDSCSIYLDSMESTKQTESIHKINALYNYQLREEENHQLQAQTQRQKKYISIFIFTTIIMATFFFAYRQIRKRKEENKLAQLNKLRKIQEDKYKQSQVYLEENKKHIEQLSKELQETKESKSQLKQDLLSAQMFAIEKSNEQIEAQQRMEDKAIKALKETVIYKKFQEAHDKMKETEWEEFTDAINEAYPQFTQRLKELYPMTEVELQICLLGKIGLPPSQIAQAIVKSKQAVTSIRKRLYKKVFKKDGTPDEWDNFIRNF